MPNKKQDPKLHSSKQPWEAATVARRYRIPVQEVRDTAIEVGKNGKPTRSKAKLYAAIEAKGHSPVKRQKKVVLPNDTLAPSMPEGDVYVNS